jgi:hypothetical protein
VQAASVDPAQVQVASVAFDQVVVLAASPAGVVAEAYPAEAYPSVVVGAFAPASVAVPSAVVGPFG